MIITKNDLLGEKERYSKEIMKGAIFLHPTDTINGIGCNAMHDGSVKLLREIKANPNNPFSVIAPSKDWILENCIVPRHAKKWLDKLPGPYTLVLRLKNRQAVSRHVNPNDDTIGVRIPKHWIAEFVRFVGVPVITTSPNRLGEEYSTDIEELHPDIYNNTSFFIYENDGEKSPSDIVILTGKKPKIIKRNLR